MSFSDSDLKQLKGYNIDILREPYKLNELVARLEAAEAVIDESLDHNGQAHIGIDEWHEAFMAWRKAAGKA